MARYMMNTRVYMLTADGAVSNAKYGCDDDDAYRFYNP